MADSKAHQGPQWGAARNLRRSAEKQVKLVRSPDLNLHSVTIACSEFTNAWGHIDIVRVTQLTGTPPESVVLSLFLLRTSHRLPHGELATRARSTSPFCDASVAREQHRLSSLKSFPVAAAGDRSAACCV